MTDGRKIGIFGMTGSGKSTLVKQLLKDRKRVVVFDTQDEYGARGRPSRFVRCFNNDMLKKEVAERWHGSFAAAYVPPPGYEAEALHGLCSFLIACQVPYKAGIDTRPLTLVVEEMDKSFPVASLPRELSGMIDMCNRGRHYGIEVIGVSQSPAQVSATFRQNMAEVYSFALGFHMHRAAMLEIFGPSWKDELAQLQTHHYLRYCDGEVTRGRNEHYVATQAGQG